MNKFRSLMNVLEQIENDSAMTGKIKRATGNEVEIEHPDKPGVTSTVDLTKAAVDQDEEGNTVIKPEADDATGPNNLQVGKAVKVTK